jgi:6-phosphogluconolactonase/glucosamine-6-phosphate isomerase/deaminase
MSQLEAPQQGYPQQEMQTPGFRDQMVALCKELGGREISHPEIGLIVAFPNKSALNQAAAEYIIAKVNEKSDGTATVATGKTYEPVWSLVKRAKDEGRVDFSNFHIDHLDGYYPYPITGAYSFRRYVNDNVTNPLGIKPENYRLINEWAFNPHDEIREYLDYVRSHPSTFTLYGIDEEDGHLGFNPKGTPFETEISLVKLSDAVVYRDRVERGQDTPDHAITLGPAAFKRSEAHLMVASGERKGQRLNEALTLPISPDRTASYLRKVGDKTMIFIDEEAASQFHW